MHFSIDRTVHTTAFDKPVVHCIKQFLSASNICLSDILKTHSSFLLALWCIKPPKIVLDLMHLENKGSHRCIYILTIIVNGNLRQVQWYTDGSRDGNYVACDTVFPSNTIISTRLHDLTIVFIAETWTIIKWHRNEMNECLTTPQHKYKSTIGCQTSGIYITSKYQMCINKKITRL